MKRDYLNKGCGVECGHTQLEHAAFDRGVTDGEAGRDENPYRSERSVDLQEAWLSGYSVGEMNRECLHLHQDYPATPINKCLDCGAGIGSDK